VPLRLFPLHFPLHHSAASARGRHRMASRRTLVLPHGGGSTTCGGHGREEGRWFWCGFRTLPRVLLF
jgi:hypothetical protein